MKIHKYFQKKKQKIAHSEIFMKIEVTFTEKSVIGSFVINHLYLEHPTFKGAPICPHIGSTASNPTMALSRSATIHDYANLAVLPWISALTILGAFGFVDHYLVAQALLIYLILDLIWIVWIPDAIPSLPSAIIIHHIVAIMLICIPLCYPDLSCFASLDGLVEINTFALILKRQLRKEIFKPILKAFFWASFIITRILVVPYVLWHAWNVLVNPELNYPLIVGIVSFFSQLGLTIFNVNLLFIALGNRQRKKDQEQAQSGRKISLARRVFDGSDSLPGDDLKRD